MDAIYLLVFLVVAEPLLSLIALCVYAALTRKPRKAGQR